jgi:hypothetical protein
MATRRRLTSGLAELEGWASSACQAERNVVYRALFAVADGSVFLNYDVFQEATRPQRYFFLVKENLMIKINRADDETFEILYIGSLDGHSERAEKDAA